MPYRIERLKPVYLFILLTAIFTLGLFTEKTLVQTVFSKKERIIEEIMVGDVNDTMNYSFEVNWNDPEYEVNRPTSVTYNLYNVLDENTIISTVTLTDSNVDSNNSNKWIGTFNNIRKYNDDETLAKYIIKQQEISSYTQQYEVKNQDSLCIEFGNNVFDGDTTKYISILGNIKYITHNSWGDGETWNYYNVLNKRTDDFNFYYEDLANKTVCVYSTLGEKNFYFYGNDVTLDIKNIYPANREYDKGDETTWIDFDRYKYISGFTVSKEYYGKNYPTTLESEYTKYIWENPYENIQGANIITNNYNKFNLKFDAYWEDEGHENLRPASAEYQLFRKDNQNDVVKSVTLTSANADSSDSHHWTGVFNEIDYYDQNGKKIEYVVKQKAIPNYTSSSDSNEGYSIKFNENALTGHYSALQLFIYDTMNDKWHKFDYEEYSGIGDIISGKTINAKLSDEYNFARWDSSYGAPYGYSDPFLNRMETHQIDRFVGTNYPESHHPLALFEDFSYEYNYSLSNHTNKIYLFYSGASWGGQYGVKIDSIKAIGDETIVTSRYNVRDLEITKKWDDGGHENARPTTTTVDIYDAKHPNDIIRTVEIKNTDSVDNNTWKKTISNLPIYDSDLQEIEYLIVERPVSGYKTIYDFDEYYNALAVKFGNDIHLYDTYITYKVDDNGQENYRRVSCPGGRYCYTNDFYGYGSSDMDNITNRTIYIPKREFYISLDTHYSNADRYRFNITDITLTHIDNYGEDFYDDTYDVRGLGLGDTTYEEYPLLDYSLLGGMYFYYKYTWNGSTVPKKNANIIINKYDKTSFEFTKIWDDVGNEDGRPESVKYNVFNEKDKNTIVKTVSLTKNNENPNNHYEWKGIASDLPLYNSDGTIAQYLVKEEVLDKYKTDYKDEYNSLCIKFGNDVFSDDDTRPLNIIFKEKGTVNFKALKNKNVVGSNKPEDFYKADLQNKEICLPLNNISNDFHLVSLYSERYEYEIFGQIYFDEYPNANLTHLDIIDIYKKKTTEDYEFVEYENAVSAFYYVAEELNNNGNIIEASDKGHVIHYTWIDDNPYGKQIITNHDNMREEGYIKEFHDTGYEYNRPKEIVFGLYVENDPIPKEMVTVNTSACINNKCNIEFKNVRDKDNDNNQINYIIKEISDYGYDVTYENDKVINTANPVEVKLIKENTEGKVLSGAKLAIYNKDGDKIKEIVSTTEEIKVKLLPSTYTIKEIEAPKDYSRCQDITLVVNKDGTYTQDGNTVDRVKIVNEYAKDRYDITLKKTMEGNSNQEFTFEVTIEGIEDPIEYTGDRTGTITNGKGPIKLGANQTITIKNIPVDSKYEIKELENDYEVEIVGESKGTLDRNETIEFINTPKEEPYVPDEKEELTPITGLYNITTYIIGLLLLISSVFLIVYSKKQMKRS